MKSNLELKFIELLKKPVKSKEEVQTLEVLGRKLEIEFSKEIKQLSQELKEVGVICTDIWDLVNTKEAYPNAIDILIKHLSKNYHDKNKEGIVRALTVKEAKGKASPVLISEYNNTPKEKNTLRWAIGNAIYVTITEKDVESILTIVQDKRNGPSRSRFVEALGNVKSEKTEDVLIKLLDDSEVASHALIALGRLKSKKAKENIKLLINHPNQLIKKEAKKALNKIE